MKTKFWKVKVKPGKPILFGLLNNIPVLVCLETQYLVMFVLLYL